MTIDVHWNNNDIMDAAIGFNYYQMNEIREYMNLIKAETIQDAVMTAIKVAKNINIKEVNIYGLE